MPRKPNDRATRLEYVRIHARLEQVVTRLDGGMCVYKDGFDDDKIAKELNVGKASVAGMRVDDFGKLRPSRSADEEALAKLQAQADRTAIHLADLMTDHNDLTERFNKLVELLALNRIVDCKHLKKTVPNGRGAPPLLPPSPSAHH